MRFFALFFDGACNMSLVSEYFLVFFSNLLLCYHISILSRVSCTSKAEILG